MKSLKGYDLTGIAYIAGGLGVIFLGVYAYSKLKNVTPAGVGKAVAQTADAIISAPVKVIGGALGIPETSQTQCQKDMAAGDNWAASFSCPAADFLAWQGRGALKSITDIFSSNKSNSFTTQDAQDAAALGYSYF